MGHPRSIPWNSFKKESEGVFRVFSADVKMPCTCAIMDKLIIKAVDLLEPPFSRNSITGQRAALFQTGIGRVQYLIIVNCHR
jgi:hypothetical protein